MIRSEHILTTLAEEGGEISKECHKALRFGLDDQVTTDPHGPRGTEGPTNAEKIHQEFVDALAVYLMAEEEGLVPKLDITIKSDELRAAIIRKQRKVESFMLYAARVGALRRTG
jgi:hypothetical protein